MTKTEIELHLENSILRREIINLNGMLLGRDLKDVGIQISEYERMLEELNNKESQE